MKNIFQIWGTILTLIWILSFFGVACGETVTENNSTTYAGPYLGQHPPGDSAVLFAPELFVRENESHDTPYFTPEGKKMLWGAIMPDLMAGACMEMNDDGVWSEIMAPCRGGGSILRPDGNRLYFHQFEAPPGVKFPDKQGREFMWYADKVGDEWSESKPVDSVVNKYSMHWQFGVAANDNLYFSVGGNLCCAEYANGRHLEQQPLLGKNNKNIPGGLPYIAPDESYIIYAILNDRRLGDLFISFKTEDETWTDGQRLGGGINTEASELCPKVTPDGKYLFYIGDGAGFFRPFWINMSIIHALKP
ncbi:MAG: hypothetical protein V3V99_02780 [candidate division Zixibacteria bacterium]